MVGFLCTCYLQGPAPPRSSDAKMGTVLAIPAFVTPTTTVETIVTNLDVVSKNATYTHRLY